MLNSDLTICPICEKRFIPSLFWAYKIGLYTKKGYKTIYYCSYHCFRKAGGGKEKFKNQPKKRGKLYA